MEQVKVFLDTNIVLDFFTGRMHDGLAARIVQIGQTAEYRMCVSVLTGINVLYVSRKLEGRLTMDSIAELFEILDVNSTQWNNATMMALDDPEDALQLACAIDRGCRVLVTRDRHLLEFPYQGIDVVSPEAFLAAVIATE